MSTSDYPRDLIRRSLLVFVGLGIGLLLVEFALKLLFTVGVEYWVWKPKTELVFKPFAGVMPGVSGTSRFSVNSDGIRGDEFDDSYTYRILTIGGSTTECLYLDQPESWPNLLQQELTNSSRQSVFVGNVGQSGANTRGHILQLEHLLARHDRIDAVILLIGINDLHLKLADESYDPYALETPAGRAFALRRAFDVRPHRYRGAEHAGQPMYKRTAIWHLMRRAKAGYKNRNQRTADLARQDEAGMWYVDARNRRQNAKVMLDTLPDLSPALEEYRRNINEIANIAQRRSVRLILLTQPVLWDKDLDKSLEDLLLFGGTTRDFLQRGSDTYYSTRALAAAMDKYNDTLLSVCRTRQLECIDMASLLPKDTTVFYDDAHFNEPGAEKVASVITTYMLRHPPFAK